jgi:hypothetical protein
MNIGLDMTILQKHAGPSSGKLQAERSFIPALGDGALIIETASRLCVSEAMVENEIQTRENRLLRARVARSAAPQTHNSELSSKSRTDSAT